MVLVFGRLLGGTLTCGLVLEQALEVTRDLGVKCADRLERWQRCALLQHLGRFALA